MAETHPPAWNDRRADPVDELRRLHQPRPDGRCMNLCWPMPCRVTTVCDLVDKLADERAAASRALLTLYRFVADELDPNPAPIGEYFTADDEIEAAEMAAEWGS
jgi:hypothetical protein